MGDYALSVINDDYQVTVGGDIYTLTGLNDENLPMVQEQKDSMLLKINLDEMLTNLLNSVNLLDIVYCSVAGIKMLPGQVSRLQTGLLKDISQSQIVMSDFVRSTKTVLDELSEVYPELYDSEYSSAIEILTGVKDYALRMCKKAVELRDAFSKRCDQTDLILKDALDTNSQMYEKRDAIQQELVDMQAELAAFETLKELLEEQINEMNEEYQKLEKKEEKAADRSFALQLTGAILGGIGELFSDVASAVGLPGGGSREKQEVEPASEEEQEQAQQELDKNPKIAEAQQEIEKLDQQKKGLEKELSELEEQLKNENQKDYDKLREAANEKKKEIEDVEQQGAVEKKKLDKVKKALISVGSSFTSAADKQQDNVEYYNRRLQEIYRLRQEVKKQDQDNKAKIVEYKQKIMGSVRQKDDVELSIKSLTMAVGSLRRVVVILNETVLFWNSIVQCCETLSDDALIKKIESGSQKEVSEGAQPFYQRHLFVKSFLMYLIRWTALNLISRDYVGAMNTVRKELGNTIAREEGVREVQWEKAAQLAENLKI